MDYDVGNQQMLWAGAYYAAHANEGLDWRPMNTAPRDGTTIEIRCTYGVAPWYNLFHWVPTPNTTVYPMNGGQGYAQAGRWAQVGNDSLGIGDEGPRFSWRPYAGKAESYVDPTGGAQNSAAYWRGAVAAKHGLPLGYFEKRTADNLEKDQPTKKRSWWRWLFGE